MPAHQKIIRFVYGLRARKEIVVHSCFCKFLIRLTLFPVCRKGESVTLKGHAGPVRSVDFASDGRHLLTGSDDKTAKIWSLPSRKFQSSLVGHSNWVRSACFSPDMNLAATASDDKTVKLWDVSTHQALHTFYDHSE